MRSPIAIDLFCGLGGWSDGLLAEGWDCIGFDIERHDYGTGGYPAQLVIQDVLTLHGSQFKNADLIVASPPCQKYSYLAMPWSRSKSNHSQKAKALRREWETNGPDNRLFDACFRIQREACEAAGRFIPLVVENVRGAIPWVGQSKWAYGSFHLWGDVPALMPPGQIRKGLGRGATLQDGTGSGSWFFSNRCDPRDVRRDDSGIFAIKQGGDWFRDMTGISRSSSRSVARKAASAQIAKIPLPLSRHIAKVYWPTEAHNAPTT